MQRSYAMNITRDKLLQSNGRFLKIHMSITFSSRENIIFIHKILSHTERMAIHVGGGRLGDDESVRKLTQDCITKRLCVH